MRKVAVCVTARPSYSRVLTVLRALQARRDVELQIIAAASALVTRYGMVVDQMVADGFTPDARIRSVVDGDSTCESAISTGVLLTQIAGELHRLRPDVVVTIADRHETLATAIAASYQNILLCHIQGGEVSGSIDDKVRNAVTQLADLHLVATQRAARNVECMAGGGAEIHITGCPSIDLAAEAKHLGPIHRYDVVVLQHPVTTESDLAGAQMEETIEALKGAPNVGWWWPGEDSGNSASAKALRLAGFKPIRNLPPVEFLRVVLGARMLVGNSSVGIRECSYLGVPVVNVGTRQAGRERGPNVIDVPHEASAIWRAYIEHRSHGPYEGTTLYGDGHAGERIAEILAGEKVAEASDSNRMWWVA